MLCGGLVGRAHGKKLQELQGEGSFSKAFIDLHKQQFPQIESVKCVCLGKNIVMCPRGASNLVVALGLPLYKMQKETTTVPLCTLGGTRVCIET